MENRWPFRLHATYDESISRFLKVFEEVNRDVPFEVLRWCFDHAKTITSHNIERVKALGGGIAIQDRMAFQGEYFRERYGKRATENIPPVRQMLKMEIPAGVGAVLSADYFTVPEEEIRSIESVLTVLDGKVVYGAEEFGSLAPPPLPVSPDWSPVGWDLMAVITTAQRPLWQCIKGALVIPLDRSGCRKSLDSGGSAVTALPSE